MNLSEINRLVAERIFYFEYVPSRVIGSSIHNEYFIDKEGNAYFDFSPATKIEDAWLLVEKFKIAVIPQAGDPPTDMQYLAEIDRQPFGDNYEAYAETAPLAICLVALKAVGIEVK